MCICVFCYKEVVTFFNLSVDSNNTKPGDVNVPASYHSKSDDEEVEILGSDDDEQEDPQDYCKGAICIHDSFLLLLY